MNKYRIPMSRLNQIARRKLLALGVPSRLSVDGERLEGEISLKKPLELVNPFSKERISRIDFVVEGHDHLRIYNPPELSRFPPQPFFELESIEPLVGRISSRLEKRAAAVAEHALQLERLGLSYKLDERRAMIMTTVDLPQKGLVFLEGDERGIFVVRMDSIGAEYPSVPLTDAAINLAEYDDIEDLRDLLIRLFAYEKKEKKQAGTDRGKKEQEERKGIPIKLIASALGYNVFVNPGISLSKEFEVDGKKVEFSARHESDDTFLAKLISDKKVLWTGHIDLVDFSGVEKVICDVMGCEQVDELPLGLEALGQGVFDEQVLSGYQMPAAGERWVMNVLIEHDSESEIRYVPIDIDGQPFGAPRVLAKSIFEETFSCAASGICRLVVEIVDVRVGKVSYERLDADNERRGITSTSRLAAFLANFVPYRNS